MGFLKGLAKVAKAADRAQKQAARNHAKHMRQLTKTIRAEERLQLKASKDLEKRRKVEETEAKQFEAELYEKHKIIQVRLKIDNSYDWLAPHVF